MLEINRYKETGTLISVCAPPCMGKTIAAFFFAYRLSLPKDFCVASVSWPTSATIPSHFGRVLFRAARHV